MPWYAYDIALSGIDRNGKSYSPGDPLTSNGLVIVGDDPEQMRHICSRFPVMELADRPANYITVERWVRGLQRGADVDALLPEDWEWLPQGDVSLLHATAEAVVRCPCGASAVAMHDGDPASGCDQCGRHFRLFGIVASSPPRGA